jgi:hypothetical protein
MQALSISLIYYTKFRHVYRPYFNYPYIQQTESEQEQQQLGRENRQANGTCINGSRPSEDTIHYYNADPLVPLCYDEGHDDAERPLFWQPF